MYVVFDKIYTLFYFYFNSRRYMYSYRYLVTELHFKKNTAHNTGCSSYSLILQLFDFCLHDFHLLGIFGRLFAQLVSLLRQSIDLTHWYTGMHLCIIVLYTEGSQIHRYGSTCVCISNRRCRSTLPHHPILHSKSI